MMNKRKPMIWLLVGLLLMLGWGTAASAAGKTTVSVRIEGISACLYQGHITMEGSQVTVKDVLLALDQREAGLTIDGLDQGYISAVNQQAAGTFGGWDGWSFMVNNEISMVGVADALLSDGDSLVLFYGDYPTQVPIVDTSRLASGVLRFTSKDRIFAADGSSTVQIQPIVGATVTWYDKHNQPHTFVTDEQGAVTIPKALLTEGEHVIQIEKGKTVEGKSGQVPVVVRLPRNYTVKVSALSSKTNSLPPKTGADGREILMATGLVAVAMVLVSLCVRKR